MHPPPLDNELDSQIFEQMQMIISIALRQIIDEKPLDEFIKWAQSSIPRLAPTLLENFTPEDKNKMAYWVGINLWNSAPKPGNHFKPDPLPKPNRNDRCPCGSEKKHKHCCAHFPMLDFIDLEAFWMLFPEIFTKTYINKLIKSNQLPINAISIMASLFADEGDYKQAIKMLEPVFAGKASQLNHQQSGLLDILCDCYNEYYKTEKKKKDLLQRMCQHKNRSIRADAWQRISSWQQDLGDFPAAMHALSKAMQAEPDNPSHSMLELTLLVSNKQIEQAKQRAVFWRRKLAHLEHELPELVNTLERAKNDPVGALQFTLSETDDDPRLMLLLEWIEKHKDLPIAPYSIETFDAEEEDEDDDFLGINPMLNACSIQPPEEIFDLEMQWATLTPLDKPFGSQFEPMGDCFNWESPLESQWLNFLQQNPQAINSLNILDDLVTLIYIHPNNDSIWGPLGKIQPLLDRNETLRSNLNLGDKLNLPWIMPENRPTLRLLAHNINLAIRQDEQQHAIALIKRYLTLNPEDNHGYRSLLVNHYLKNNDNIKAIEFTADYLDDMLAETRYGLILALYRIGELEKAEELLPLTLEALPLVAQYLIKARVAQPELNDFGIQYGGDDQAWFYREEMREIWKQSKGSLEWLKKQLN